MAKKKIILSPAKKKIVLWTAGGLFVLSVIAIVVALAIGVDETTYIILIGVVAVTLELAFWAVALVFGISMFESRKKIWAGIKSKFSRQTSE